MADETTTGPTASLEDKGQAVGVRVPDLRGGVETIEAPAVPGYKVHGLLGRGGMGAVFAAHDYALDREVAIKTLLPGAGAGGSTVWRFETEARVTARLPHPSIPPVHALGTLPDGTPYLAMKRVQGRTLADLLRERPDPSADLSRFVQVFEQVCQAVGFAHAQGVIHRDLKPGNVMVGQFGEVQVMDWGLAKVNRDQGPGVGDPTGEAGTSDGPAGGSETRAGSVLGTPRYMAPEQARGEPVDGRADVFALGAVLCAILTGFPPYAGDRAEVLRRAAAGDLSDAFDRLGRCGADPDLVALTTQCLSPDPARRPATGQAVADAVETYRTGVIMRLQAAEVERAAAEARAAEQHRKRRWQLAAAVTAAVLLLAGAGFGWWQDRQATQRRAEEGSRAARNGQAIESRLERCEAALRADNRAQAETALAEIDTRTADGSPEVLRDRIDRCRADLAMLKDLDRIDTLRWTPVDDGRLQAEKGPAEWREAFRRFGIVPGTTPPAEAARRIRESLIRDRLLAALDHWLAWDQATEVLPVVVAADPEPYRGSLREALAQGDNGRLRELADRPEALQLPPRMAVVLGEALAISTDRRAQILTEAHSRRAGDYVMLLTLGNLHLQKKKAGAVGQLAWFGAALAVRPDGALPWLNIGVARRDLGDPAGAVTAYREAMRLGGASGMVYHNLGLALLDLGDLPEAEKALRESLRLRPNSAGTHAALGGVLRKKGDPAAAADEFREAARLNPNDVAWPNALAGMCYEQGDLAGAATHYRAAVRINPGHSASHNALGIVLSDMGDREGAAVEYKEAIRLDPKDARPHNNLGNVWKADGDVSKAEAAYRKAVELDPKFAKAHYNLGLLLGNRGRTEDAIACYRQAVASDARMADAWINLANLLLMTDRDVEAEEAARGAVRAQPNNLGGHVNLSVALHRQRKLPEAEAECRTALRLNRRFAPAHKILGDILTAAGDPKGAEAAYREAAGIDPKGYGWLHKKLAPPAGVEAGPAPRVVSPKPD